MNRTLGNTIAVLAVTTFTALAIVMTVSFSSFVSRTPAAAHTATYQGGYIAASSGSGAGYGQTQTCPATGCTATSCHAAR